MKFKSLLERDFAKLLERSGITAKYETTKFPYTKQSSYTPDWEVKKNVYLETKGEFTAAQRSNLLSFLEQHPHVQIIMVFAQAENKIHKKSKTTYAKWCEDHNIDYINLNTTFNPKTREYNLPKRIKL